MILVPKFSENDETLSDELLCVVNNKIEIQMITKDLMISFNKCVKLLNNLLLTKHLDEVVLHLPFSVHMMSVYVSSTYHLVKLNKFINAVIKYSNRTNINIGILFHQEESLEFIQIMPNSKSIIKRIFDMAIDTKIYFLMENCLPSLNGLNTKLVQSFEFIKEYFHSKLYSCIDLCHIRCWEVILDDQFCIPEYLRGGVRWLHFSDTKLNDGFRDHSTHSRPHDTLQKTYDDLKFLSGLGIDIGNTPIIAEISEKDYKNRPGMLEELKLLNTINSTVISI